MECIIMMGPTRASVLKPGRPEPVWTLDFGGMISRAQAIQKAQELVRKMGMPPAEVVEQMRES